jgi:hypothetical protein
LIVVPVSVTRVEPVWKMKTALASPSKVSVPPTSNEDVALYTPGPRVLAPWMKPGTEAVLVRPAASL